MTNKPISEMWRRGGGGERNAKEHNVTRQPSLGFACPKSRNVGTLSNEVCLGREGRGELRKSPVF